MMHVCLSCSGSYAARDTLREWQEKNHPWLELTDIHRETTENIRVTVMPFYIGSRVSTVCLSLSASVSVSMCVCASWNSRHTVGLIRALYSNSRVGHGLDSSMDWIGLILVQFLV